MRRPDIEGLRAVAVLVVLGFHLELAGFAGGWIGVDAFFVISGFVITDRILADRAAGEWGFARFYAARARRILPAAALVLVATVGWLVWFEGALASARRDEVRSLSLFVGNEFYARNEVRYGTPESPFQHYWSLAVEEQFYVVWPVLLAVVLALARRPLARVALVLASASASFALLIAWGDQPLWAFYRAPARAWELLAGAALALGWPLIAGRRARGAPVLGWAALAALGAAVVAFEAPVGGLPMRLGLVVAATCVLIAHGGGATGGAASDVPPARWRWGVGRALGASPLRAIGARSYVLYLWHLPVIVALDAHEWRGPRALSALVLTVALAELTHRLVERPVHRSPALVRRPMATLAGAATLVAIVLLVGLAGTRERALDAGRAAPAGPPITAPPRPDQVLPADATPFVPSDLDPPLDRAAGLAYGDPGERPCTLDVLLGDATVAEAWDCPFGDVASDAAPIVLVGDSHAWQWWSTFDAIGRDGGRRVIVQWKPTCGWVVAHRACAGWWQDILDELATDPPALVVLAQLDAVYVPHTDPYTVLDDARRARASLPADAELLVLRDAVYPESDPLRCLADHLDDVRPCDFEPKADMEAAYDAGLAAAAEAIDAPYVETAPWVCATARCPLIRGRTLVYKDDNHISYAYALGLADEMAAVVDPLLR